MASIKLAVLVIASLATLIAIGTFVEADYNAEIAAKTIYKTPWMFGVMGLLSINLTAVMVDRWPWKRRHVPFILAHIGILVLLFGSVLTMLNGLDGNISFGVGQKNRFVQTQDTDLTVWMSFDGERFSKFLEKPVDFYRNPPTKGKYFYPLGDTSLEVLEYWPFAMANKRVEASDSPVAGSALRFQIQNSRVNVNEWLVQTKKGELVSHNLGPAQFFLGEPPARPRGLNELYIKPTDKGLEYTIYYKDENRKTLRGHALEGDMIKTGWMDLEFRILRFLPKAEETWIFDKVERPNALTTSAIRVSFLGKERWIQLDDAVKVFTENVVYIITYGHRRIDIGFDMALKEFQMGTYPGTNRAASYQSLVTVDGLGNAAGGGPQEHLISMNEPLKYNGLTFYQASFSSGPDGKPNASILSVNFDPGRWFKYLGSLIICLGIVSLFYDKRKAAASAAMRSQA